MNNIPNKTEINKIVSNCVEKQYKWIELEIMCRMISDLHIPRDIKLKLSKQLFRVTDHYDSIITSAYNCNN